MKAHVSWTGSKTLAVEKASDMVASLAWNSKGDEQNQERSPKPAKQESWGTGRTCISASYQHHDDPYGCSSCCYWCHARHHLAPSASQDRAVWVGGGQMVQSRRNMKPLTLVRELAKSSALASLAQCSRYL